MKTYLVNFDYPILLGSISVWIAGTLILSLVVRRELAAVLMFLKLLFFITYFCYFADGTWFYGGDDWGYFQRGLTLAQAEPNVLRIWSHPEGYYLRHGHSLSLIFFHNYLAIVLFGENYFAPVLLNVFLTSILVTLLAVILRRRDATPEYLQGFVIFASLHWTILAWSSFLNLKEIMVSLLMVCAISALGQAGSLRVLPLGATLITLYLFLRLRFYFPAIILVGWGLSFGSSFRSITRENKWIITVVIGTVLMIVYVKSSWIRLFFMHMDLTGAPYGLIHFVLQPAPWKITEPASYLLLPSVLHWVMLPAAIIGAKLMWSRGFEMRIMVGVLIAGIMFYGLIPSIASTRHRVPFDILLIVAQYQFIWNYGVFRFRGSESR